MFTSYYLTGIFASLRGFSRKLICTAFVFLAVHISLLAQPNINRVEYYVDTDPGYGNATAISIGTGNNFANLNIPVNQAILSEGVHRLYVRAKSANGWSLTNTWLFYKPFNGGVSPPNPTPASNISRVEYYFDNDPGLGSATNLPIGTGTDFANLIIPINPTPLSEGVHRLFVRAKSATGWSLVNTWLFYKPYGAGGTIPNPTPATNISRIEYYLDSDPGYGNATALTIGTGTDFADLVIPVNQAVLAEGVHRLYVRAKSGTGWSLTNSWLFYKPYGAGVSPPAPTAAPNLKRLEYFIDTDPGLGLANPVAIQNIQNVSNIVVAVNLAGLSIGSHQLNVRAQDSTGSWSLVDSLTFNQTNTFTTPNILNSFVNTAGLCAGDSIKVSYSKSGTFNAGNVFNLELSSSTGSFTTPTIIGSFTGTSSAIINGRFPQHLTTGTGYRVRVRSTSPVVTGTSSAALSLKDRPAAQTITGNSNVNGTFTLPYSVTTVSGSSWNWIVSGGIQTTGGTTNSINIQFPQPPTTTITSFVKVVQVSSAGCAGDTGLLNLNIYKLRIDNTPPNTTLCKGATVTLPVSTDGAFDAGNVFTAQLSNPAGSFASPVNIGTVTATNIGVNQLVNITATIPAGTADGTGYRIRVISSGPAFTGNSNTADITIAIVATPTASVTAQPTCAVSTGTIVVTAPTGAGITYSIGGAYQASGTFSAVLPGNYAVTAKNAGGCTSAATNLTVNAQPGAPAAPTASVTAQPTCAVSTGTIVVTAPTGAGITYSIGGTYQSSGTFNNVAAGTYSVTAQNASGCISGVTSVTVNPPPGAPATPTASVTTQPTCAVSTGTIVVTAPTGAGITYSIGGAYQASGTFNNVAPGTYAVTAQNASGCISSSTSLTVNAQPATPAAPTATVTAQPTCAVSTGTIVVTAPTGAGITYSIGGTYQSSGTFNNIAPGTYAVTAQNASGCISGSTSVTVNAQPATPATPTASVTAQPTCTVATGTIVVTAPTGAGITYSIGGTYQSSGTFNNVAPGTYAITAQNASGCISASTSVTVNAQPATPAAPTASVTAQPTCTIATGIIVVTAPTGAGITYSIGGTYQSSGTFNTVVPGAYVVTAQNASGCISSSTSVTVNAQPATPIAPSATVTAQPTCTVATGTIVVTAPTGAGITYSIGGTYQASGTFNNVAAGTYAVTAQNASSCISSSTSVTVNAQPATPVAPTASVTAQPTCTVATGTIVITAPTGAGLTYSIGSTYQSGTSFTGVFTGTYQVTVKNSSGCISSATALTVNTQPATPGTPAASVTTQPTCAVSTGTIVVTAPTGAGITYSIGGTYQSSGTFTNVAPGTYQVTAQSSGGCISASTSVTVNAQPATPVAPTASVTAQPTCAVSTGTIVVTAPTGAGITYSIGGTYQSSGTFNNVAAGTYSVTAQNAAGCISAATSVTVNPPPGAPATPTASVTAQPTCAVSTGTIEVTAPTGAGITYSIGGTYQVSGTFNNVAPGTYAVTAQNASGCISSSTSITINAQPATPATPTASVTAQPTCAVSTGTIVVTAPTGAGITYSIGGGYQASGTFNNVVVGTYAVTAQNASGCISGSTSVTVNAQPATPVAPTATVTAQPTCTVATGTIVVTAPTGAGITYSIGGTYQSSGTFNNVAPGTYAVTAQNASGCISSSTSVTVNAQPATPVAPTTSVTAQPICTIATGTIVVTAPTGAGITYGIGGTYQSSGTFNNVAPGTYAVTAQNASGCISSSTSVTVNAQPATPIAPTASVTAQPTCAVSTGTIVVTAPTGAGITYSIGGTYQSSGTFNNVAPGTYAVTAQNASGCISASASVTVNAQPATPVAPTASVTAQPTCTIATGTIVVTAPTGAGINYSIGGAYQSSGTFNNVAAGTYLVTAQNAAGCISSATSVTVNPPPGAPATPTASVTVQPTCAVSTGTIVVTAPTGAGITYSIGGAFQSSGTFSDVTAGTYLVTAQNANGCKSASTSVTVNAQPATPIAPTASVSAQPTCALSTGTIVVTAPTGAGITYSIGGTYQSSGTFNNVAPGTYAVTAQNASGCISASASVTVNAQPATPVAPTASVTTQPTCVVATGTIVVTAPTGAGITYSIGGAYQASGTFNNVAAGTYSVTAQNASGCISGSTSVTVNAQPATPVAPTASVTAQPTCAVSTGTIVVTAPTGAGITYSIGGTYQSSGTFNNVAAGTYSATAKNAAGCISTATSVTVNPPPGAPATPTASVTAQPTCVVSTGTIVVTAPTGAGITYSIGGTYQSSGTFNNVAPGTYAVTAQNASGCISGSTSVTVNAQPATPVAPSAGVTAQPTCTLATGTITVTAPTGAGITYSIGGTYQSTGTFNNVVPGTYAVTAQNASGCISASASVTVNAQPATPVAPTASVTAQPTCAVSTGTIVVTAPTGAGINYSIGGTYQSSGTFNNVAPGTYAVTAQNASGCISASASVTVNAQPATPVAPTSTVTAQPTCAVSTGTIVVTAPTGAGITYSIGGAFQSSGTFNNVAPGTYSVTAQNASGCISGSTSVTVNAQPATPVAPTASVTAQPTCTVATGTIVVTAPTGAGITYSIGGTYQASGTFNNVAAGTYAVTAQNASGCISSSTSVTVNAQPATPVAPTASVTAQPTCAVSTGTIVVTAPTGAGIAYSIGGAYQSSGTFNSVTAGTYLVTAQNALGCVSAGINVTVNAPPGAPATPTASVTAQPTCAVSTGTIVVTAPTGAGITYSIGGAYQASGSFNNVASGTYAVTAQNASGCISAATSVTVNTPPGAPATPTSSVTLQPTCAVSTGTIVVTAPTGAGITYSIGGTYQSSGTFNSVAAGTYLVTAKNASGCISGSTSLTVDPPPGAPATPTASVMAQPTCAVSTGTIVVTAPTGAGITYSIGGAYQASGTFNGIAPGTYLVTAQNASGCTSGSATVIVNAKPIIPSAPIVTGVTNVCQYIGTGQQVTYTASAVGATSYAWVLPANVTVVSGAGSSTIVLLFNNGYASQSNKQLRVTASSVCGTSPVSVFYTAAQIPSTPGSITGPVNVCPFVGTSSQATYTIRKVAGASEYIWTAQAGTTSISHPNGNGINDTTITILFGAGFSASALTVQSVNDCGISSVRSLSLTRVLPATPGIITGPTNVCANIAPNGNAATYSTTAVAGTTFTWNLPPGVINFVGQGTASISFTYPAGFSSGTISVTASNGCGTSNARSINVAALYPLTPSAVDVINLQSCPNRVYSYSINNNPGSGTYYQWTAPAGSTIVFGQGTTSITVSYPATAINSNVTVTGVTNCASSQTRTVAVRLPACPIPFTMGSNSPGQGNLKMGLISGDPEMQVKVFPNPTTTEFNLSVITAVKEPIEVSVFDLAGRMLKEFNVPVNQTIRMGAELRAGQYMVKVKQGNKTKTVKVVKF